MRLLFTVFLLVIGALPVFAQVAASSAQSQIGSASPYTLERGMNEFGVWGGVSFDSPAGSFLGTIPDRKFVIGGLRYGRILAVGRGLALEYTVDVIPVAIVTDNPKVVDTPFTLPDGSVVLGTEIRREPVYGFGASPIGFQVHFGKKNRVKPFASGSAGFLYFSRQTPVPDSQKFNYSFDFGGGVEFFTRSRRAFVVGYKLHHLSNANQGRFNPGLDANIFYGGFSIFK